MAGRSSSSSTKRMGVVEVVYEKYKYVVGNLFCPVCGRSDDFHIDIKLNKNAGKKVAYVSCGRCGFKMTLELPLIADELYAYAKVIDAVWGKS